MGKHFKQNGGFSRNKKSFILLASLVLILTVAAGGTLAFLITSSGPVVNTFTPTNVTPQINETFDGSTKESVSIKNTGNTDAYIRVALVMNWQKQNEDGQYEIASAPVTVSDYTMTWNEKSGYNTDEWISSTNTNGVTYYYYKKAVKPGENTGNLFDKLEPSESANVPEGYTLVVDVLAQAIQSKPKDAVEDAWGKTIADQLN